MDFACINVMKSLQLSCLQLRSLQPLGLWQLGFRLPKAGGVEFFLQADDHPAQLQSVDYSRVECGARYQIGVDSVLKMRFEFRIGRERDLHEVCDVAIRAAS